MGVGTIAGIALGAADAYATYTSGKRQAEATLEAARMNARLQNELRTHA